MDLYTEAIERFRKLYTEAQQLDMPEPSAVSLASVDADGRPSVRTILLKGFDPRGFVFYTNKQSRKGRALKANGKAALCFLWQPLMQQVQVEGTAGDVSEAGADAYWATRIRLSQIGAWASEQSAVMPDKDALQRRFQEFEKQFAGKPVPRPPHWSGFRLKPESIEFWSSRPGRLHERERYMLKDGAWTHDWLYP
ncbi:MAG TPA: pyridoxamine 5'-phosphate oxidase [Gammaproteobacteria bacterium]|nr:pyridoxamine 5'-phosphate oxidase [Gammaproteobacteria bacterium]